MPFMSVADKAFWNNCPPELQHLQDEYRKSRKNSDLTFFIMGAQRSDNPPTIVCLKLGPGEVLNRHRHDCYRFEVIVQGSLNAGDRVLKPGDVMTSEPNVPYGPHAAGPEGCVSFEIFSNHKASYSPLLETPDGPVPFDASTPEGLRKYREAAARVAK